MFPTHLPSLGVHETPYINGRCVHHTNAHFTPLMVVCLALQLTSRVCWTHQPARHTIGVNTSWCAIHTTVFTVCNDLDPVILWECSDDVIWHWSHIIVGSLRPWYDIDLCYILFLFFLTTSWHVDYTILWDTWHNIWQGKVHGHRDILQLFLLRLSCHKYILMTWQT